MERPYFSVIIPTFNRANTINRTIDSVLRQSFSNWEISIVDDGSADGTEAGIQNHLMDPRIKFYRQTNQGVSIARNHGAEKSSGEFFTFLDSDDEMTDDFLMNAQRLIMRSPGASCFCFGAIFKREGKPDNILLPKDLGPLFKDQKGLFLAGTFVVTPALYVASGGYDPLLSFGENDEFGQRICSKGAVTSNDDIALISYRSPREEKNRRYKRESMARTLSHYLDVYRDELISVDIKRLVSINNRLAVCYFVMGRDSVAISILRRMASTHKSFRSFVILIRMVLVPGVYRKFLNKKGFE